MRYILTTVLTALTLYCSAQSFQDYRCFKLKMCIGSTPTIHLNSDQKIVSYYASMIGETSDELDITGDGIVTIADLSALIQQVPNNEFVAPSDNCLTWGGSFYWSTCGSVMNISPNCGGVSYLPMSYHIEYDLQARWIKIYTTQYGGNNFEFIYVRPN